MRKQLYCIVEGQGEKKAVPTLVKLALKHYHGQYEVDIPGGHVVSRGQIVQNKEEFKKALRFGELSLRKAGAGMLGVFLDADDDNAADLRLKILDSVGALSLQFPVVPIIFTKEYEAFFITDQPTLRRHQRVRPNPNFAPVPEAVQNAKGHFEREVLRLGDKYDVVIDQDQFTRHIDYETLEAALAVGATLKALVADLMAISY